jgi:hypothetical protein
MTRSSTPCLSDDIIDENRMNEDEPGDEDDIYTPYEGSPPSQSVSVSNNLINCLTYFISSSMQLVLHHGSLTPYLLPRHLPSLCYLPSLTRQQCNQLAAASPLP